MKTNFGFDVALVVLLASVSAFADFQLKKTGTTTFELSQSEDPCTAVDNNGGIGSVWCSEIWKTPATPGGQAPALVSAIGMVDIIGGKLSDDNTLELASDLEFGGFDASASMCNQSDEKKIFEMIVLVNSGTINFNGNGHTVKGACYENSGGAGFIKMLSGEEGSNITFENVNFDNAYFAGSGSSAIIAPNMSNVTVKNVKISSSTVVTDGVGGGDIGAGALAGVAKSSFKAYDIEIKGTSVKGNANSTGNVYGGCIAGFVDAEGYSSVISGARIENCAVEGNSLSAVGGLVGGVNGQELRNAAGTLVPDFEIQDVKFSGSLKTSNADYVVVGGAIGSVDGNFSSVGVRAVELTLSMDVDQAPVSVTGSAIFGGIFGSLGEYVVKTSILNTSYVGDVQCSFAGSYRGYLIGFINGRSMTGRTFFAYNNFYVGSGFGADGIGSMNVFASSVANLTWQNGVNEGSLYIAKNYRSGSSPTSTVAAQLSAESWGNETLSETEMRSSAFAGLLNDYTDKKRPNFSATNSLSESWVSLGDVPTIRESSMFGITLNFSCVADGCLDYLDDATKAKVLSDVNALGANDANAYTAVLTTDASGKLTTADALKIDALLADLGDLYALKDGEDVYDKTKSYTSDTQIELFVPFKITLNFSCVKDGCLNHLNETQKSKILEDMESLGANVDNDYHGTLYANASDGKLTTADAQKMSNLMSDRGDLILVVKDSYSYNYSGYYSNEIKFDYDSEIAIKRSGFYVKYFMKYGEKKACFDYSDGDCVEETPYIPLDRYILDSLGLAAYSLQSTEWPDFIEVNSATNAVLSTKNIPDFVVGAKGASENLDYLSPTGFATRSMAENVDVSPLDGCALTFEKLISSQQLNVLSVDTIFMVYETGMSRYENSLNIYVDGVNFKEGESLKLQMTGFYKLDPVVDASTYGKDEFDQYNYYLFSVDPIVGSGVANGVKTSLYPYMRISEIPSHPVSFGYGIVDWKAYFTVETTGDDDKLYQRLRNGAWVSHNGTASSIKDLFESENDTRMELEMDGSTILEMSDVSLAVKKYLTEHPEIEIATYGLLVTPVSQVATYTIKYGLFDDIINALSGKKSENEPLFVSENFIEKFSTIKANSTALANVNEQEGTFLKSPASFWVYPVGKCYADEWIPSPDYTGTGYNRFSRLATDKSFTDVLEQQIAVSGSANPYAITLYPSMKTSCQEKTLTLVFDGGKYGDVLLKSHVAIDLESGEKIDTTMTYPFVWESNETNAAGNYELKIPVSGLNDIKYKFTVVATPDNDYELEGLVFTAVKNGVDTTALLENNGIFELNEYGLSDMKITAKFKQIPKPESRITISLDLGEKQGADDVFYVKPVDRENSINLDGSVEVFEENKPLPSGIYTSDMCLEYWEYDSEEGRLPLSEDNVINSDNWPLVVGLAGETGTFTLHAKWKPANECVGIGTAFNQWRLSNSGHGAVRILEAYYNSASGKYENKYHVFGEGGLTLMPKAKSNEWRLDVMPDSGYKFESVYYFDELGNELSETDDEFYSQIRSLKVVFVENAEIEIPETPENPTAPLEIVNPKLEISGNAIRLDMATNWSSANEIVAEVTLLDALGMPIIKNQEKIYIPVGKSLDLNVAGLPVGYYLARVSLTCEGKEPVVFERDFEVKMEIVENLKDEWQMLSPAIVDFERLPWDGDVEFFWWDETDNSGDFWQYRKLSADEVADPTRGYWYSSMEGRALSLKDSVPTVSDAKWNLLHVYSGWNLVANPYGWYMRLNNLPEGAEVCHWDMKAGDYNCVENVESLKPFEAVWVKVASPVTMSLPESPDFVAFVNEEGVTERKTAPVSENSSGMLSKSAHVGGWSVVASLADKNGKTDRWNVLGADDREVASEEPPTGMGNRVNLSIVDGKRMLNKSFRKKTSDDVYEWDVELSATSNRVGYLSFDGIASLAAQGLKLFVTVNGNTVQMKDGEPLQVSLKTESKVAKVRVAKSAPVSVAKRLDGLRAMRQGEGLLVQFATTAALAGSVAKVELVNLKGEVVAHQTLKASAGVNSLNLNVSKTGAYMLRVSVGSQQAAGKVLVR